MWYGMNMPSRNILKVDIAESYYHVYARGVNKSIIFHDEMDFTRFLSLLKRYLSKECSQSKVGLPYPHLYNKLELLCFCLMPNHFHILLYQAESGSMTLLMRGVMTSYSRYYNKKYQRTGPLFESRYKASRIDSDNYLHHISRYIHLNPNDWQHYKYSSVRYYLDKYAAEWVRIERVMALFKNREEYKQFLEEYKEEKAILKELKYELANTIT